MRNLVATLAALTNDDDGICASQSAAGAQALTINGALASGGVASWSTPQLVTITSAGNDTGITFTITGQDPDGTVISQAVTGANATAASSTYFFKRVTSVVTSGATAGNVIVGVLTTGGAVSKSLRVNGQQMNFKVGLFVDISGTCTYTVQYAYQQPEDTYAVSYSTSADWRSVDGLAALTADGTSNVFYKVNAVRLKVTAYTSGTETLTATQSF